MTDTLIVEASPAGHKPSGRKRYGDEQLFARLIGAAVLLALAVIVLPFVLDGSGSQREYEYAETLPVEPPSPAVEKSFSSRQPPKPAITPETVEVRVPETTSLTGLETTRTTLDTVSATPTTESAGTRSASPQREPIQRPGLPQTPQLEHQFETIGKPLQAMSIQSGWNIQVASFVRDENAIKLLNRLHAENLPAYINQVRGNTRTVLRVMVGPYSNQIDALALQNRIDKAYQVESLMVRK